MNRLGCYQNLRFLKDCTVKIKKISDKTNTKVFSFMVKTAIRPANVLIRRSELGWMLLMFQHWEAHS